MPTRIVPLVLNDSVLPDGELAFILDVVGQESVTYYSESEHYRQSKMKAVIVLQCADLSGIDGGEYTFTVRSPFPNDTGNPSNAPNISMQVLGDLITDYNFGTEGYASINDETAWGITGDITPAPSFTLYTGTIPAWVFVVKISPDGGEEDSMDFAARIVVDFSHSIT